MNELELLITGLGVTFALFNSFYKWIDNKLLPNKPPFNCDFCISLWVGIIFSICFLDIIYLSLPLLYRLVIKLINRL